MSQLLPPFSMRLARNEREVALAQRLRHRIFVEELGGCGGDRSQADYEADRFDRHCEHLLLDAIGDGRVIGTTRLMSEDGARAAGGFASEDEFDLSALRGSGRTLLEVGRTCILPEFRGGSAMHSLWMGLAGLVHERGVEVLFGLASFPGTDPAMIAQSLAFLHHDHLAPVALRPISRRPVPPRALPADELDRRAAVLAMPALLKAYLRLGGKVGDGAFVDTDFRCIDVCLVLDTTSVAAGARAIYAQRRA